MFAILSIFFNNTPIVALFIPIIKDWCRKNNFSPSKFLIPLSYTTIAGGMCSLLGTSTNLLVHGFLKEIEGQEGFGFFETGYVGFPCAAFIILYLFTFSFICLPDNKGGLFRLLKKGKTFISQVEINKTSDLKGKTIKKVKQNYNIEFIEIIRKKPDGIKRIVPVPEKEIIELNDTLIVSGDMNIIMDMIHDSNIDNEENKLFEDVSKDEEEFDQNQDIDVIIDKQPLFPENLTIQNEIEKKRKSFVFYPKTSFSDVDLNSLFERKEIEIEQRRSLDFERPMIKSKIEPRNVISSTLIEELNLSVKKIREVDEDETLKHKSVLSSKIHSIPSNDPISQIKKFYQCFKTPFTKQKIDESNTVE